MELVYELYQGTVMGPFMRKHRLKGPPPVQLLIHYFVHMSTLCILSETDGDYGCLVSLQLKSRWLN